MGGSSFRTRASRGVIAVLIAGAAMVGIGLTGASAAPQPMDPVVDGVTVACLKVGTDVRAPYKDDSCPSGFDRVEVATNPRGVDVCTKVKTDWRAPYKDGTCPSGFDITTLATGDEATVCTKVKTDVRAPYRSGLCPSGFDEVGLAFPRTDPGPIDPTCSTTFVDGVPADWTNDATHPWTPYSGMFAEPYATPIRSGVIGNDQASALSMTVEGPVHVQYQWRVHSESIFDVGRFKLNGLEQNSISGLYGSWESAGIHLPHGTFTLTWVYEKDGSTSEGHDLLLLGAVTCTPVAGTPGPEGDDGGIVPF